MPRRVVSATVDAEIAEKLDRIAAETQRKKSYFVNLALTQYFEEIEDNELALRRWDDDSVTIQEARRELGL